MVNFGVSHFNIEDERKKSTFGILCIIISRKVDTHTKERFLQCVEKMLWLIECVKSGV